MAQSCLAVRPHSVFGSLNSTTHMTTTGRGNRVAAAPKFNITTVFANRKAYVAGVVAMVKALHIGRLRETDMFSFFLLSISVSTLPRQARDRCKGTLKNKRRLFMQTE